MHTLCRSPAVLRGATHHLEHGTVLRYMQNLLGYATSKTTEIYTHGNTKYLGRNTNPKDALDE